MRPILLALVLLVAAAGVAQAATTHRIEASTLGYVAPVVQLASGDAVVWGATDTAHVQVDGPNLGGGPCFFAVAPGGGDSEPVAFTLDAGVLRANGEACGNARVAPGGAAALLPYFCSIHPTMRGALVVTG